MSIRQFIVKLDYVIMEKDVSRIVNSFKGDGKEITVDPETLEQEIEDAVGATIDMVILGR